MDFVSFTIDNFKGIRSLVLPLNRKIDLKVFSLIGLNESGKTTILEAISNMGRAPYDLKKEDPSKTKSSVRDHQSFIPVAQRYNFSGEIRCSCTIRLSPEDVVDITEFIESQLGYKLVELLEEFSIKRTLQYRDSKYDKGVNIWTLIPTVRKPHGRKNLRLDTSLPGEAWIKLVNFVEKKLPPILYFRNEVFDIPDQLLVSSAASKSDSSNTKGRRVRPVNEFYSEVIQDILTAIDPNLSLDTHIVKRKRSAAQEDVKSLAGLLQKMGQHITTIVMRQWETIFGRKLANKRVQVTCEMDADQNIFLQLKLEDGGEIFDISERSTGFRWFFVFILLTQYRGFRHKSGLFLYDEPASNLHASAQRQLLNCFESLPSGFKVIYSTHSHYLVNPHWLDSAFIVRNEAIGYDNDDIDMDVAKTDITATPYRQFVAIHPSALSYFQPVLEVLKYVPSDLEGIKPALLLEGKSDYFTLAYLISVCLEMTPNFDLVPCMGSGTVDDLIALYSGWGKKFFVLLDSDKAGEKEKLRYQSKFLSLTTDRVATYADIDPAWKKYRVEDIVGLIDRKMLQEACFPGTPAKKETFHLAIQELLATKKKLPISDDTRLRIEALVKFIHGKI